MKPKDLVLVGSPVVLILFVALILYIQSIRRTAYMDMQAKYARQLQLFVCGLDELASAGRTNEIHQAYKTFMSYPTLSWREEDISNFTRLACDTYDKAEVSRRMTTTNRP